MGIIEVCLFRLGTDLPGRRLLRGVLDLSGHVLQGRLGLLEEVVLFRFLISLRLLHLRWIEQVLLASRPRSVLILLLELVISFFLIGRIVTAGDLPGGGCQGTGHSAGASLLGGDFLLVVKIDFFVLLLFLHILFHPQLV